MNSKIFVEGKADQKFLQDFIKHRFNRNLIEVDHINIVKGKDNLRSFQVNFSQSSAQGFVNLVIFDANGSFQNRKDELELKKQELGIQFEYFLFPNNHDPGTLETLLRQIARHPRLFDCIDKYGECLSDMKHNNLRSLDKKTKIFIYDNSFLSSKSSKEGERDYLNAAWDMDSSYLDNLHKFLSPYFG